MTAQTWVRIMVRVIIRVRFGIRSRVRVLVVSRFTFAQGPILVLVNGLAVPLHIYCPGVVSESCT